MADDTHSRFASYISALREAVQHRRLHSKQKTFFIRSAYCKHARLHSRLVSLTVNACNSCFSPLCNVTLKISIRLIITIRALSLRYIRIN